MSLFELSLRFVVQVGIVLGACRLFGAVAVRVGQPHVLGQIGVVLYMFLVGVEFRTDLFRAQARDAVAVSVAGIVVPFVLGSALAAALMRAPGFFPAGVGYRPAMLFLGASMSITAFPAASGSSPHRPG